MMEFFLRQFGKGIGSYICMFEFVLKSNKIMYFFAVVGYI